MFSRPNTKYEGYAEAKRREEREKELQLAREAAEAEKKRKAEEQARSKRIKELDDKRKEGEKFMKMARALEAKPGEQASDKTVRRDPEELWSYKTIKPGNATQYPSNGGSVRLNYIGYLPDGKVFDSSYARGKTINFIIGKNRVIQAWDECLLQMSVGEKIMLLAWPEKAYGRRGYPPSVPPQSKLLFEIHLLGCCTAEIVNALPFMKLVEADRAKEAQRLKGDGPAHLTNAQKKRKKEAEAENEKLEVENARRVARAVSRARTDLLENGPVGVGAATSGKIELPNEDEEDESKS
eukprot:g1617.t1